MEEEKVEKVEEVEEQIEKEKEAKTESFEIKLDFEALEAWRDEFNDDLPIHSMISFYRACGVADIIEKNKEKFNGQVAPIDSISCNFYTQKHIKNFVSERWEIFSMSLLDNNKVVWNTRTYEKGAEHYHRSPSKRIVRSLNADFLNYCPKLDDELEDNVLVVTVREPEVNSQEEKDDTVFVNESVSEPDTNLIDETEIFE